MPRFTEKEKAFISDKLLAEGEKLFSLHGLKKVTVDDLAVAANISKGSFYAFYPSKEHLYIEINFQLQQKLFENIETSGEEEALSYAKGFNQRRHYDESYRNHYFSHPVAD